MSEPTVSICIPAYGRPYELRQAIVSVLEQDYEDLEIVVGDDSGDLEDTVKELGDGRIRYFRNTTRLGMAGNWSRTLDLAHGRYRGLLMDDDMLLPGFLKRTVDVLEADPQVGVVFTNHYLDRGSERTIRSCPVAQGRHDLFLKTLLLHRPVAVSAAMMREEAWLDARPLPDLFTADIVMQIRIVQSGWAFFYVDAPLMAYRVHEGQLSAQEERPRADLVRAWEMFEFSDAECEALRRRFLSSALLGRAANYLKAGHIADAQSDVSAARAIAQPRGAREAVVTLLAHHNRLRAAAVWSWKATRRIRRR